MISSDDIRHAYQTTGPYLRRTPTVELELDALAGTPLVLKLEHLQCAGSFKARGAFTNLLLREVPEAGVVAASGGNHGVAVAYAASRLGVRAKIFVPTVSSPAKVDRIRRLGAELVVVGDRYADALAEADAWVERTGAMSVHAFDQRETIVGAGSVGLELAEQVDGLDTVLVPVGGGGLVSGVSAWFAGTVQVIGVEPDGAPTLTRARAAGRPVDAPAEGIAADALAPRRVGELVFPIAEAYVHDVVLVDDDAIRAAREQLWLSARLVVEPAACVGVAALLVGAYRPAPGERVAVVLSGANTDPSEVAAAEPRAEPAGHPDAEAPRETDWVLTTPVRPRWENR